jgi:predicted Zn-dependent peptidase
MYKKQKLDNGLRIVAAPMPRMQSAALGIWVRVGGRHENAANKGTAHFLEHLLFKGSKNYTCRKLKEAIEGVGGALNGFTSEELTCYLVKTPAKHIESALDVLSDMVIYPTLPECEIEKEKTVITEEIKMYRDQPQSHVYELLDELLWPEQPLGAPIIGTEESVNAITRKSLVSFKERHYNVFSMVISVAGLFDYGRLTKRISRIYSPLKAKEPVDFLPVRESQNRPQIKLLSKETEQTHLALGFHALKRDDPLRHAMGLLHVVLGGNMSSRLFNELREDRGLAYEIGTGVKRYYDTGAFLVHAGIDNSKVTEAVSLILKELSRVKTGLVTDDEFRRAKEFYRGQMTLALEDTMDSMLWIGETTAALDKTYTLEELIKEINKVRKEDIRQAARFIFENNKMSLALIGPLKDKEGEISKHLILG